MTQSMCMCTYIILCPGSWDEDLRLKAAVTVPRSRFKSVAWRMLQYSYLLLVTRYFSSFLVFYMMRCAASSVGPSCALPRPRSLLLQPPPLNTEKLVARQNQAIVGLGMVQRHAVLERLMHRKRHELAQVRQALRTEPALRNERQLTLLREWIARSVPARSQGLLRLEALVRSMRLKTLRKVEPLIAQFEAGGAFCIVLSGRLSQYEVLNETELDDDVTDKSISTSAAEASGLTAQQQAWLLDLLTAHHRRELGARSNSSKQQQQQQRDLQQSYPRRASWKDHVERRQLQAPNVFRLKVFCAKLRSTALPSRKIRHEAATKVQGTYRNKIAQRIASRLGLAANAEIFEAASTRLQARVRSRAASRLAAKRRARVQANLAAVKVQSIQRGRCARGRSAHMHRMQMPIEQAAAKIQAHARANADRSTFQSMKGAAIDLQARIRGRLARSELEEKHVAATHIQNGHRRRMAQHTVAQLHAERIRAGVAHAGGASASKKPLVFMYTASLIPDKEGFGDAALLFAEPNLASVIADKATEVAMVSRYDYLAAVAELDQGDVDRRAGFLASIPALRTCEPLSALAGEFVGGHFSRGHTVTIRASKMLIVEHGELVLSSSSHKHHVGTARRLLVVGPGSLCGASPRTQSMLAAGRLSVSAFTECSVLWIDVALVAARLEGALDRMVAQEEEALRVAFDMLRVPPERSRPMESVWSSGALPQPLSASLVGLPPKSDTPGAFRISPQQVRHDFVPRLRPGVSVGHAQRRRGESIWSAMQAEPEFPPPEVIRPPLPRSGPPPLSPRLQKALEAYFYLPELPLPATMPQPVSPAHARGDGRWSGTPSWSRSSVSLGSFGARSHPKPGLGEKDVGLSSSRSTPLLLRPGSAVIASSSMEVLIADPYGRWKAIPRRF